MDTPVPAASETVVVWFRRDLRLADHPALTAALAGARAVVPLYVLDERLLTGSMASPARTWFLVRSLAELHAALQRRGSGLIVRHGRPDEEVPRLARETGAASVLATRDVTPFSYRRDRAVAAALEHDDRRLRLQPGLLLAEPEAVLTTAGRPYGVYSPFSRALQAADRRAVLLPPDRIPTPPGLLTEMDALIASLAAGTPPHPGLPQPGEAAARARLSAWVQGGLAHYGQDRNGLDGLATSHLGADLHLGTLSALQVESAALELGEAARPFVRQVAWREFYHHLLFHQRAEPDTETDGPLGTVFRGEADDPEAVNAWREGRTGVPVVDAAMRQLAATGWISNRARLVVASFLTRHLLMDHRIGERHFMRHLLDGDVANNVGGWRWTAGVGADPQPWFRIMNPVLQGRRFDTRGEWVRHWVPELARVPEQHIHAPWEMPASIAASAGVHLGEDYPLPIVDLQEGRQRALAAFRSIVGTTARAADGASAARSGGGRLGTGAG
jgi:deoxyribodipyrimidine photo-lyase